MARGQKHLEASYLSVNSFAITQRLDLKCQLEPHPVTIWCGFPHSMDASWLFNFLLGDSRFHEQCFSSKVEIACLFLTRSLMHHKFIQIKRRGHRSDFFIGEIIKEFAVMFLKVPYLLKVSWE